MGASSARPPSTSRLAMRASRKFLPPLASSLQMSKNTRFVQAPDRVDPVFGQRATGCCRLRALVGCSDDEIRRLGVDSVSWRGARFSAVLIPAEPQPAE